MTTLHIFPTADYDEVAVSTSVGDSMTPTRLVSRDTVFATLSNSEFRRCYDDVIYYQSPVA